MKKRSWALFCIQGVEGWAGHPRREKYNEEGKDWLYWNGGSGGMGDVEGVRSEGKMKVKFPGEKLITRKEHKIGPSGCGGEKNWR